MNPQQATPFRKHATQIRDPAVGHSYFNQIGNPLARIKIMKRVSHSNILKLFEVFEDEDEFFLVMELYVQALFLFFEMTIRK